MSDTESTGQIQNANQQLQLPKVLTNTLDQLHEPYVIKDLESRYIYANPAIAKLAGLRSPRHMMFKKENEFHSPLTENLEIVDQWQSQDRLVAQSGRSITMLEINLQKVDHPYLIRKLPLYNEDEQCVGIVAYSKSLELFNLPSFVRISSPASLRLTKPDDFFSEQECEIICLKLQHASNKQIGNWLGLPVARVDEQIATLYEKAGVDHADDFTAFCEQRDYHRYLPESFICQQKNLFKKNNAFLI
ncbi:PAS domain-containing protein [Pantoea sp. B65]|uniref:PAS domain-containing protein n=1 Tax=Pantoea sp. B65 TaxID=2813359 RepID=UPI0039B4F338